MARIRTLKLPGQVVGELVNTPFVFVLDGLTDDEKDQLKREDSAFTHLAEDAGARGYIRTSLSLDFEYD